ncbi:hypothetical protein [Gemmata massiliana]|uniref:hypothetical protein n=1 Tax=Gemmata massiliana TaxID=1210884 RepID=UPI0013A6CAF6|nr:hypothetical protein [Gemmata massiliana]
MLGAAPVPKHLAGEKPFWPTAVGTQWVYTKGELEVTDEIVKAEKLPESILLTVRVRTNGRRQPWEATYELSKDAVLFRGKRDLQAVETALRFPIKNEDSWEVKPPPHPTSPAHGGRSRVEGTEDVRVPAGTFRATKVVLNVTELNGQPFNPTFARAAWYVQGIGLVKLQYGLPGAAEKVLKSFTPGK